LRSSQLARVKKRPSMAALFITFAIIPARESQKAAIQGCTPQKRKLRH
jgi:hypothetical protein